MYNNNALLRVLILLFCVASYATFGRTSDKQQQHSPQRPRGDGSRSPHRNNNNQKHSPSKSHVGHDQHQDKAMKAHGDDHDQHHHQHHRKHVKPGHHHDEHSHNNTIHHGKHVAATTGALRPAEHGKTRRHAVVNGAHSPSNKKDSKMSPKKQHHLGAAEHGKQVSHQSCAQRGRHYIHHCSEMNANTGQCHSSELPMRMTDCLHLKKFINTKLHTLVEEPHNAGGATNGGAGGATHSPHHSVVGVAHDGDHIGAFVTEKSVMCCRVDIGKSIHHAIQLINNRLIFAHELAIYKFAHEIPIDDPEREAVVLKSVGNQANAAGIDAEFAVNFLLAQMEANKMIQRGYMERWNSTDHSFESKYVPDLEKEIHPQMSAVTHALILALIPLVVVNAAGGHQMHKDTHCMAHVDKMLATMEHLRARDFEPSGAVAMARAVGGICDQQQSMTIVSPTNGHHNDISEDQSTGSKHENGRSRPHKKINLQSSSVEHKPKQKVSSPANQTRIQIISPRRIDVIDLNTKKADAKKQNANSGKERNSDRPTKPPTISFENDENSNEKIARKSPPRRTQEPDESIMTNARNEMREQNKESRELSIEKDDDVSRRAHDAYDRLDKMNFDQSPEKRQRNRLSRRMDSDFDFDASKAKSSRKSPRLMDLSADQSAQTKMVDSDEGGKSKKDDKFDKSLQDDRLEHHLIDQSDEHVDYSKRQNKKSPFKMNVRHGSSAAATAVVPYNNSGRTDSVVPPQNVAENDQNNSRNVSVPKDGSAIRKASAPREHTRIDSLLLYSNRRGGRNNQLNRLENASKSQDKSEAASANKPTKGQSSSFENIGTNSRRNRIKQHSESRQFSAADVSGTAAGRNLSEFSTKTKSAEHFAEEHPDNDNDGVENVRKSRFSMKRGFESNEGGRPKQQSEENQNDQIGQIESGTSKSNEQKALNVKRKETEQFHHIELEPDAESIVIHTGGEKPVKIKLSRKAVKGKDATAAGNGEPNNFEIHRENEEVLKELDDDIITGNDDEHYANKIEDKPRGQKTPPKNKFKLKKVGSRAASAEEKAGADYHNLDEKMDGDFSKNSSSPVDKSIGGYDDGILAVPDSAEFPQTSRALSEEDN